MRFGVVGSASQKESTLPDRAVSMIEGFLDAPMPEPKARKSTMSPHKPEDWPRQVEQHLNAGDLEAVVALCEPEARFVARSGDTVIGRDPMREVLAGMIRSKTRLQSRVIKAIPSATSRSYTPTFRAQQPMTWERRSPSVTRPSRSCAARMMAPGSSLLDAFAARVRRRGTVCDVGCGPGHMARYLKDRGVEVCGVGLSAAMVQCATHRNLTFPFTRGICVPSLSLRRCSQGSWRFTVSSICNAPRCYRRSRNSTESRSRRDRHWRSTECSSAMGGAHACCPEQAENTEDHRDHTDDQDRNDIG